MKRLKKVRAVVSGTKTGGHLYPATVVGARLAAMGMDVTLVASGEAVEDTILRDSGLPVLVLRINRLKGAGKLVLLKGFLGIPVGMLKATRLLMRLKPDLVVGFGGFTTGPLLMAASMMKIPCAICEENSIPGLTNRVLARFVSRVFVAYEGTADLLHAKKVVRTGTPVRPAILAVRPEIGSKDALRVLVFGGSQGSSFLNECIPPVMARLVAMLKTLRVHHQTGKVDSSAVKEAYDTLGVEADVVEYIHDMADAYGHADFVICRSGAGTVAEVSAIGMPALFVPFAAASDNHQVANAVPLTQAGGAFMVEEREFDEKSVAELIGGALVDRGRLREMARASATCGNRDALDLMVSELKTMVAA